MIQRLAYRPAEAAKSIGVSQKTVYRLMEQGHLRSFTINTTRLITADELRRFITDSELADNEESNA